MRGGVSHRSSQHGDSSGQVAVTIHPRNELDTEVSGLRAKVRLLKQVAGDIHSEALQQQTILEQLEQTLVTSQAAMKEGMRKLNKALSSGGGSYVFHVLLFALGSFLLVYLWSKFR